MAPPAYAGLTGRRLGMTIFGVATMGFLLFGYDRKCMRVSSFLCSLRRGS